jgi:hypothetical protein
VPSDALHFDAHAARAAGNRAHGRVEIRCGQVRKLGLRDLLGLGARDAANFVGMRARATLVLPLSIFAAFLMSTVAGGVFMMKVKLLSAYAVITTGTGRPGSIFEVCALNALQNSMMLRPRWPSAGPIGGEGFALPAGT